MESLLSLFLGRIVQALHLLRDHIRWHKVCLVIDNVCDEASFEEAKTLLNLPFKQGSLILVTSRSFVILERLKVKRELVMKIPSLSASEARALFIHHTGCDMRIGLSEDHKRAMEMFVGQCNFKVEDGESWEYHPLALKVLGTRVGSNPNEWEEIKVDSKFFGSETKDQIFSILRSGYDALEPEFQRMFLDLALTWRTSDEMILGYSVKVQLHFLHGEELEGMFPTDLVKILHSKSLIESYDVDSGKIYIHDLYRDFAKMEVEKMGLRHSPRCCFYRARGREHVLQEGRVRIGSHPVCHVTKKVLECTVCSKAELLSIRGCANLESIDVPDMLNLRVLEVIDGCPQLRRINLEGAVNLQFLHLRSFSGEFPELTSLESLEELWLLAPEEVSPASWKGSLDFSRSSNLEILMLTYLPLRLLNLNGAVRLTRLFVGNCKYLESFEGLESLVILESVDLQDCSSLLEFPSLEKFPRLSEFTLEGAAKLKKIQGFAGLTALQFLSLKGGKELKELPGIEACTKLTTLDLSYTNLDEFSWVSLMKDLVIINLLGTKIRWVPDCGELSKLSELWLKNCQALESQGSSNMGNHSSFPQNLQVLSARNSRSLKIQTRFDYPSTLTGLDLSNTSVEDVSGVLNCVHLQALFCAGTRITSLPDLSRLTSLEILDVRRCELLTRMDNIKGWPALKYLLVQGCTRLFTLPDLRRSTGLTRLELWNCPLVDPNSVQLPAESMVDVEMEDAAED